MLHAIEELSILENNAYWDFRALMRDESYLLDLHTALTLARFEKKVYFELLLIVICSKMI